MRKTVCVDLDGVLADYSQGWQGVDHIGEPIPGAREFLQALSAMADVVIFTTRCNPEVNKPESVNLLKRRIEEWLHKHGMPYDDIYTGIGKPIAAAYVDDRAIECLPQNGDPLGSFSTAITVIRDRLR